ncbi:MAG: AI-2E family transporter [Chitinophagales bacterium]|nr:AI-2E family transporter [Chitinophagales bacterium]
MNLFSDILVPLILALFLAVLFQPILAWLDKKKVPLFVGVGLLWLLSIGIMVGVGYLFYNTFQELIRDKEEIIFQLKTKLDQLLSHYESFSGQTLDIDLMIDTFTKEFMTDKSTIFIGNVGEFLEEFLLTIVYLVILMSGIMRYENYLHYLAGEEQSGKFISSFEEVKTGIVSYVEVKFFTSFLYGIGVFIICKLFGLRFAFMWGFLSFMLNFIPLVGALIALVPVFFLGLIQFDNAFTALFLIVIAYVYHALLASAIEPYFLGKGASLNIIAVIVGLLFWGFLWGIPGMFLSVPLTVLVKVVLAQIEGAEIFVRLLGTQNGIKK